jgi:hypothetical protein
LKLGEDSCAEIFDGNTVEPAWVWAAEKMERDDVVAVLGRPDSGKPLTPPSPQTSPSANMVGVLS